MLHKLLSVALLGVVAVGATLATPSESQAGGFSISVGRGGYYTPHHYAPRYVDSCYDVYRPAYRVYDRYSYDRHYYDRSAFEFRYHDYDRYYRHSHRDHHHHHHHHRH